MIKRDCENKLLNLAKHYSIVMVSGPRQSGKTTLCRHIFKNKPYVLLEDFDKQEFANKDPRGFLAQFPEGAVLDEVQKTPILINYLQGIVDSSPKKGLFILSGSQNLLLSKKVSQSLAGRTAILNLLPLTFNEVLLNHKVEKWEELALKGFFPKVYNEKIKVRELLSFYFRTYIDRDIRDLINVKNMITFQNFIKLCAGRAGQVINIASLGNDAGISHQTAREWLSILETSFILFRLPPYFKNFSKRIIKAPKLYFYDVGLLSYLLDIETVQHITNHPLRGNIFENLIVTDLVKQKYNNAEDHGLYYFRDSNGNEVDLLEHSNEAYRIMEIKSGLTINTDFFKGLDYFSKLETKQNVLKYLVYGGNENQKRTDYSILGYKSCENFWK